MSKTKKSSCNSGFDNITHCKTKTTAKRVKELADDCNIDTNIFTNKSSRCEELLRKQGGGLKKKGSGKKSPKKKVSSKKVSSKKRIPAKHADEYKKLNEMKKKDLSEFSGDITQGKQDGKLVSVNKLRKHELILAIINGKNPKRSSEKRKSNRSSEKRKSKRFLINEITGMTGEKIKDKDYSYDEVLHRYNYLLKKERKKLAKLSQGERESMIRDRFDDLNDRHDMIEEIASITGKDPNFYTKYNPDEIIDMLEYLREIENQDY
jgi:cell division protein FtsB